MPVAEGWLRPLTSHCSDRPAWRGDPGPSRPSQRSHGPATRGCPGAGGSTRRMLSSTRCPASNSMPPRPGMPWPRSRPSGMVRLSRPGSGSAGYRRRIRCTGSSRGCEIGCTVNLDFLSSTPRIALVAGPCLYCNRRRCDTGDRDCRHLVRAMTMGEDASWVRTPPAARRSAGSARGSPAREVRTRGGTPIGPDSSGGFRHPHRNPPCTGAGIVGHKQCADVRF
jgi:hypothetical protein